MSCVPLRRLLAGWLLGAAALVATPAAAQASRTSAPAAGAPASAGQFAQLCATKLKLAPVQAAALHTYLDQEVNYLNILAVNSLAADTPDLTATESGQLDQVVAKLLTTTQLRDYHKLRQMPQAQTYLRSMALLPDGPANYAKPSRAQQRRNAQLMAQPAPRRSQLSCQPVAVSWQSMINKLTAN
ncbi:MAG: hypothetical protein EOO59_00115 [Hymenobacter sp.]|nr:MAG: hypothetical protein EOO59_00115 [Hymenobacter sp.]